ncbi:MAG: alpha/beta fold hydrolase [Myxococcota bacterium]
MRWVSILSAAAGVVFLATTLQLGSLERGGPRHADLMLEGGIPATLFLPGAGSEFRSFLDPPSPGEGPPVLVLAHGFAGDRRGLSSAARRLALSGLAVLTLDLAGHGENRNPGRGSYVRSDSFHPDLVAAVDFLRLSPHVDGSRIAVGGHSMGAGAALDFATRDSGIDAVVLISGGWDLNGPYPPPNALFLYAEADPERIRRRSDELAARIAGRPRVDRERTYGDVTRGTGVRVVEVSGASHASIVWTDVAIAEIKTWLDEVFGLQSPAGDPVDSLPADPRTGLLGVIGISILFVLPGLGLVVGRLAPDAAELVAWPRGLGLAAVAAALLLTMPLLALGPPFPVVPLAVANVLIAHFALAGVSLLVLLAVRGSLNASAISPRTLPALLSAGVAVTAVLALLQPLSGALHGVSLTPERGLVFVLSTLALLPFSLAVQLWLRRGSPLTANALAAAGRVVVVLVLLLGMQLGLLHRVMVFVLGPLCLIFVGAEVLAAAIYVSSRNRLVIAIVDAAWLAFVLAAIMPIRV